MCAEGGLESEWEIEHLVDLWIFRDVLSKQMLQYSPTHQLFPGEDKTRSSTVQTKTKRRRVKCELEFLDNVTYYMFDGTQNKFITRSGSEILCRDLTYF